MVFYDRFGRPESRVSLTFIGERMAETAAEQLAEDPDTPLGGFVFEAGAYRTHRALRTALEQSTGREIVEDCELAVVPRTFLRSVLEAHAGPDLDRREELLERLDRVPGTQLPVLAATQTGFHLQAVAMPGSDN